MRCTDCGIDRWKLHRHHIVPKSQGGADDSENVVAICANCHEDRHGGLRTDSLPWQLAHTPEAKAKRSATFRRLWQDPAYRSRMLEARRAKGSHSAENNARRGEGVRRTFASRSPEQRAEHGRKIADSKRGRKLVNGRFVRPEEVA